MDREREERRVERLILLSRAMRYDRRQILKRAAAFGLSAPAIAAVLAACGGDDDDDGEAAADETTEAEGAATESEATETEAAGGTGEEESTTSTEEEDEGGGAAGGGIINVSSTAGDAGIGNPILNSVETWVEYLAFNKLVMFDHLGELQPFLAESWEFSDDNLELTFTLAEATWHDGEPFTADDVIFTFDLVKDEATDTPWRSRLQVGGEYMTWEAPDERTIKLTMTEPFAPVLFNINAIGIVPKHILEGQDVNTSDFNTAPVGTGPFKVAEWQRDQFIRLERNPDYFKSEVLADGFTVFFTEDANANIIALENGDMDMIFTPPENQERFQEHEQFNLNQYVYYTSITLAFNHKHPMFQDLNVRKAFEFAIDKENLAGTVTRGRSPITNNQFAQDGPLDRYNNYQEVQPSEFNQEEAARLLDEAGFTMSDGVRQKDGEPMAFNVITYAGFDEYQNGMEILQAQLEPLGIQITPNVVDLSTLEAMWADPNDDPANRALELEEWPHPFEFDPDLFRELHSANVPPQGNYMWYQNPDVDKLIEDGRGETDPDARVAIYQELDVVRSKDLPCIPLYLAVDAWVVSKAIKNRAGDEATAPYYRQYRLFAVDELWKQEA